MAKAKLNQKRALAWRVVFTVELLAVTVYLLTGRWDAVVDSLHAAGRASLGLLALAALLMTATFFLAAAVYGVLALRPLRYRQTLLVELAGALANRLLPAGLGGLGLNGVYLYHRKHTPAEATAVVSVNNLLGMAAHVLLLAALLAWQPQVAGKLFLGWHWVVSWVWVVVTIAPPVVALLVPVVRRRLTGFVRHLLRSAHMIGPTRILRAAALSALITISYTFILFAVTKSVGVNLGLVELFIVFSVGMLVGTATPTPGGLVSTEAALFAGLIGYKVSDADAGAIVLLFRLITYWLPLIPGVAALWLARARALI